MDFSKKIMYGKRTLLFTAMVFACLGICIGMFMHVFAETPKLVFTGVRMQSAADGSVQALVDVNLREYEGMGVGFTMSYDKNIVEPSNITDNQPLTAKDTTGSFLLINGKYFPQKSMLNLSSFNKEGEVEGRITTNPGIPDDKNGDYIFDKKFDGESSTNPNVYKYINANTPEGLKVATLSFRVKDPQAFAKLDKDGLEQVFSIKNGADGKKAFDISYVDITKHPPEVFYNEDENLGFEFQLENTISKVLVAKGSSIEVSAAEIYKNGTENDLIDYLNAHMRDVVVQYADGASVMDKIRWGENNFTFEDVQNSSTWHVKGGEKAAYRIKQNYNDEVKVEILLKVRPVNIIGYKVDKEFIAYRQDNKPTKKEDLQLPKKVKTIFDRVVPGHLDYKINILGGWKQESSPNDKDFFDADAPKGEYKFVGDVDLVNLPPWATIKEEKARAVRVINDIDIPDLDNNKISAVVEDDGTLVVTVEKLGTLTYLHDDTTFEIKMPNGQVIDRSAFNKPNKGIYEEKINYPGSGQAQIKIRTGVTKNAMQEALQSYINMGKRLGRYGISAKIPDNFRTNESSFSTEPRRNVYTGGDVTEDGLTGYHFDYSGVKKDLFPFHKGDVLLNTVNLPGSDVVDTTYMGTDGKEPGKLGTITVDAWTKVSGDPDSVGDVVVYKGILSTTEYSAYGKVENLVSDKKFVKISVRVKEERPQTEQEEKIDNIDDFTFNTQRVGYSSGDIQSKDFLIENIGEGDIRGLNVTFDAAGEGAFRVVQKPVYYLNKGERTEFVIAPREGLPSGRYTGKVTVSSNRTSNLRSFYVNFTVSDTDIYKVEIRVNDPKQGKAVVVGGMMFKKGDTVTIKATPNSGYRFSRWTQSHPGDQVAFTSDLSKDTTFIMPGNDVIITANFAEEGTSDLYKISYGNSPYGLIMNDDSLSEDQKSEYKKSFDDHKNTFIDSKVPKNGVANIRYREEAWGAKGKTYKNYDKDEHALFIYNGQSFKDPGLSDVKDSKGNAVASVSVSKKITVDVIGDPAEVSLHKMFKNVAAQTIDLGTGYEESEISALKDLVIRPGVYEMEYKFNDYDGRPVTVKRAIIVLSKRGDVNIDKKSDTEDAKYISEKYRNRLPFEYLSVYEAGARLYKYRICDFNGDGNVNAVDAKMLKKPVVYKEYYM